MQVAPKTSTSHNIRIKKKLRHRKGSSIRNSLRSELRNVKTGQSQIGENSFSQKRDSTGKIVLPLLKGYDELDLMLHDMLNDSNMAQSVH